MNRFSLPKIDFRWLFAVGLFAMTWRIIELVADNPGLLDSSPFMQLITPIAGAGGLLLVAAFLFGSNRESAQKTEALSENARQMRTAGLPVGREEIAAAIPVSVVTDYSDKSDTDLARMLIDQDAFVEGMRRDQMIARLIELDSLPKEPPYG